jgi:phosphate transport system substrate-binding protein
MVVRRFRWLLGLLCAALALSACGEQLAVATPRPASLLIAGATSMHPVLHDLASEFMRRNPHVQIVVHGGGSTLGEEQVAAGRIDLAASYLLPPEANAGGPPGIPLSRSRLVRTPIGVDGLAIVVHGSNDVEALSLQQLRDIFAGHMLDWQEVGGAPGEIMLVSREDGSGARILFETRVMDEEPVSLTAVVMPTSGDVVDYVSKTPSAIGYVSRSWVLDAVAAAQNGSGGNGNGANGGVRSIRVVRVEGYLPVADTLRTQTYPLIQPIYLTSRGEARGVARQFIDFALSPVGQVIVGRYHLRVR